MEKEKTGHEHRPNGGKGFQMLEPDRRYDAVVMNAGLTQSEEKGTPALWFSLRTQAGTIDHSLWITGNTSTRVAETMAKCFGTTMDQLCDMAWLDAMGENLRGSEVSITTKWEENKDGSGEVRVQWMNPRGIPKKPPTQMTRQRISSLFGGKSAPSNSEPPPFAPIADDDVPF